MYRKLIISTLLLLSVLGWAENPNLDYPTDTIEGVVVYRYPVERSIGLYRIHVNFDVSQATIIEWNPFLGERGVQYGDTLYIPTGRPIVTETNPTPTAPATPVDTIADTTLSVTPVASTQPVTPTIPIIWDSTALKVALLLPLQAGSTQRTEAMDRFVDFYEGSLIALKDRQDSASMVDLYVYDTGKDTTTIIQLMDSALLTMNAIIGPAYPQQVALLDTFIQNHAIPTLVPFTNDVPSLSENPYIALFNSTSQMEADTFLNYLERRGELTNTVLIEAKEEDIHKDIQYIREQIIARELPHTQTRLHDILTDSIFTALQPEVENIVLFNSTKFANVQILLPHLVNGSNGNRVAIYSQFAWLKERILIPQVYTTIFATDTIPALANYESAYSTYFGHRHASLVPRYDLLGYDLTRQFLDILTKQDPTPGLQSDIRLQQVGEGGYINTHITLIHK